MSTKRRNYSPQFKAKVALAALKNDEPIAELAARFDILPTMINNCTIRTIRGRPS
jgi:transposase